MPRTMESIMTSHDEANKRRDAGQPIWDHHVKGVKAVIEDEDLTVSEKGQAIANILERSSWYSTEYWAGLSEMMLDDFACSSDEDDLNWVLDKMYDTADACRVWIG